MRLYLTATAALTLAALLGTATAQHDHDSHDHGAHDHGKAAEADPAAEGERIGDPWPLDTCVVAGMELGSMGDPIVHLHEGREVRFCCAGCIGSFEDNPAQFLDRADVTITQQQADIYPLDYCIVDTDEKLSEEMSENVTAVIGNRLLAFCCPGCESEARANPARYLEKLDKAVVDKQGDDYPLETCVISGQPLDSMGGPVDHVLANHLVRLCCKGCLPKVEEDPAAVLAKLEEARKAEVDD